MNKQIDTIKSRSLFLSKWRVLILPALVYFSTVSCGKIQVYGDSEAEKVKKLLISYQDSNISVDSFKENDGVVRFTFSDGSKLGFDGFEIPILTIDIMGFWRLNGERLQVTLDSSGFDVINSLGTDGEILGIIEGYTDWFFLFKEGLIVSLKKTLFTSNPDSIVRGINHRGYRIDAPENTLPAFRLSKLKGFKYVETDVRFTSDGVAVLLHDGTVDRTSNGSGGIKDMSWDEVRSLDFGAWKNAEFVGTQIPSLEELLSLCQDIDLCPYIEIKAATKEQIGFIVSLVEEYGLKGKAVFASFSSDLLKTVLEFDSSATVGYVSNTVTEEGIYMADRLKNGSNTVFYSSHDYSNEAVSLCRKASLPLETWTINSEDIILSLPDYISGVTSDYLHAGRVLEKEGAK